MADEEQEKEGGEGGGEAESGGGEAKKSKLPIIIIAVVVLLLVAGGAAFFLMSGGDAPPPAGANATAAAPAAAAPSEAAPVSGGTGGVKGPTVNFNKIVVNLADPGGKRFLKTNVVIELDPDAGDLPDEVAMSTPKIKDNIIAALTSKTFDEVSTFKGKQVLKQDIMARINSFLESGKVINVYFDEFVIQ